MQQELFEVQREDIGWEVLEIRDNGAKPIPLVYYCHTRPKNWIEPEPTNKLPWES